MRTCPTRKFYIGFSLIVAIFASLLNFNIANSATESRTPNAMSARETKLAISASTTMFNASSGVMLSLVATNFGHRDELFPRRWPYVFFELTIIDASGNVVEPNLQRKGGTIVNYRTIRSQPSLLRRGEAFTFKDDDGGSQFFPLQDWGYMLPPGKYELTASYFDLRSNTISISIV
jgi:hypothetical protein